MSLVGKFGVWGNGSRDSHGSHVLPKSSLKMSKWQLYETAWGEYNAVSDKKAKKDYVAKRFGIRIDDDLTENDLWKLVTAPENVGYFFIIFS